MARGGGVQPGQGGAEGTDELVLSLHADACEMLEVTSVEEGHDVESDVAEERMSALVKLAKEICESCDIGQPAAEFQLMVLPSKRKLVTQRCELPPAQGGAEDTKELFSLSVAESKALICHCGRVPCVVLRLRPRGFKRVCTGDLTQCHFAVCASLGDGDSEKCWYSHH